MPRERSTSRPTGRTPRKKSVPVDEIRQMSAKAQKVAATLDALATQAEAAGIKELQIDGANAFDRGLKLVRVFISGTYKAVEMATNS